MLVCIKRDLEVLCLLEVQVSVLEGSWRCFWSLGGVLKNFGGHLDFGGRTKAGLVLFGGISNYWMCWCPHSTIVQVFTSGAFLEALLEPWTSFEELWRSFEVLEAILSLEVHKF